MKRLLIASACLTLWIFGLWGTAARAEDWKPIDPAHLAQKTPVVDPSADAEAIFWEMSLADNFGGGDPENVIRNYIRIKVFTERGKEAGNVELPFYNNGRIGDIAGRTIKPDGSIVELKKDAIFDRTLVKVGNQKVRVKTFALPAVEPGCIIEYRWTEHRDVYFYVPLTLQRELPVQQLTLRVKPIAIPGYDYRMRVQLFNGTLPEFKEDGKGFYLARFQKIPALREEPLMPPEDEVRQWMLLYYTEDLKLEAAKYWKETGKRAYDRYKDRMKVTDDVRAAATTAIGNAATPEEKLERLFTFCQTKIRNAFTSGMTLTPDELKKMREKKGPSETLKRGYGTFEDIDLLFAAMANAAGFTARLAKVTDRSDAFFKVNFADDYFLRSFVVAVQVGADWKFYDPGVTRTRYGMLRWQEEGMPALIPDPKESRFIVTPISKAGDSLTRRTGKFALDEGGTLTGEVRIEYTGHRALDWRYLLEDESPAKQEEFVRRDIQSVIGAEVSDIKIENFNDSAKSLIISCKIVAPGYAKRTGKRLFIPVSIFEQGAKPMFSDATRTQDIYLKFPWAEEDNLTISVPDGFELDNANAPQSFELPSGYGKYETSLKYSEADRFFVYRRSFSFGKTDELMRFPSTAYPVLKQIFDAVHKQDEHTVILKAK